MISLNFTKSFFGQHDVCCVDRILLKWLHHLKLATDPILKELLNLLAEGGGSFILDSVH